MSLERGGDCIFHLFHQLKSLAVNFTLDAIVNLDREARVKMKPARPINTLTRSYYIESIIDIRASKAITHYSTLPAHSAFTAN